jgi:DNA-binding YbaB/EbfC family protein
MNPLEMMKNLQKMQETMQQLQEKMKTLTAAGSAGGDMVKVTVNGQMEVLRVELAPESVDAKDLPLLEDLVRLAVNDAMAKVKDKMKDEWGPLGQGLGFPGFPGA